jgi:phosphotransferase system enzyme I (PtsP)
LVSDARDRSDEPEAVPAEARTRCKTHIRVQANVNLIRDVEEARKFKAEGIGLYRSEFPFIVRNDFPSEEEQFTIYQKVIGSQGAGEVVMRTLDVGGDKILQYLPDWYEANPFLGLRGIRFSLAHRDLFVDQLRAMLRAGVGADLRILFPMISSVDEYDDARGVVADCLEDMRVEGIEHNPSPKVGALIELPSAIESVTELNKHADFLCVGTNDLVMYVVGVDRTNYRVGNLYRNFHPAVLRALKRIVDGMGRDAHKLSICGEAGADPALIPFFVGLGVRKISVDPRALGRVKGRIGEISVAESKRITRQMLGISSLRDMEAYLAELAPES